MRADLGPDRLIGGHRLLRLIGRGSQSQVWLAEDASAAQVVALKLSGLPGLEGFEPPRFDGSQPAADQHEAAAKRQTARSAFERTTRRIMGLPPHPHIVAVMAAGIDGSWAWLAMEPVSGGDLQRYTLPARLLPEPLVLRLAQQIASALAHAHQHGIVHRDLKPSNVLVHLPSGTLKLADFGLARTADAEPTATGLVPGTPAYMAPEQLAGQAPTPSSDLYALGVILFELLTGSRPHQANSMGELLRQVATQPAADLALLKPELPAAVSDLVAKLLNKRPVNRGDSARQVAQTLTDLLKSLDSTDSPCG